MMRRRGCEFLDSLLCPPGSPALGRDYSGATEARHRPDQYCDSQCPMPVSGFTMQTPRKGGTPGRIRTCILALTTELARSIVLRGRCDGGGAVLLSRRAAPPLFLSGDLLRENCRKLRRALRRRGLVDPGLALSLDQRLPHQCGVYLALRRRGAEAELATVQRLNDLVRRALLALSEDLNRRVAQTRPNKADVMQHFHAAVGNACDTVCPDESSVQEPIVPPADKGLAYCKIERGQRGGVGWSVSVWSPVGAERQQLVDALAIALTLAQEADAQMVGKYGAQAQA